MTGIKVNRKHKDRLFRMIFKEKEDLLELYNALNNTNYTNAEDLEINTLEDAVFMKMKNDVSFMFNHELHLYEHQSTRSGNMPLRGLLYIADVLRGYIANQEWNIFSSKRLPIPFPRYIVFYNAKDEKPDRWEQKLSDAYEVQGEEPCLEFRAILLNVNYGHNKQLMERSRKLYEYATLIHYIRANQEKGFALAKAVEMAVNTCIEEGTLEKFLRKNRGEVCQLLLTEFNEQKFLEQEREVWKDEGIVLGLEQGIEQGLERGIEQGLERGIGLGEQQVKQLQVQKKLTKGKSVEIIADELEEEVSTIQEIISHLEADAALT